MTFFVRATKAWPTGNVSEMPGSKLTRHQYHGNRSRYPEYRNTLG